MRMFARFVAASFFTLLMVAVFRGAPCLLDQHIRQSRRVAGTASAGKTVESTLWIVVALAFIGLGALLAAWNHLGLTRLGRIDILGLVPGLSFLGAGLCFLRISFRRWRWDEVGITETRVFGSTVTLHWNEITSVKSKPIYSFYATNGSRRVTWSAYTINVNVIFDAISFYRPELAIEHLRERVAQAVRDADNLGEGVS